MHACGTEIARASVRVACARLHSRVCGLNRTQTCPIRVFALVAGSTSYRKHMGSDLLVQSIEASPSASTDNFTRATGPTTIFRVDRGQAFQLSLSTSQKK